MRRLLLLLTVCLLAGCGVTPGIVERDILTRYPGCKLDKLNETRKLGTDDRLVLAKFTYTCKDETHLRYGNLVYTKSMDTGFTIYCCEREATPEEL
ncbi:hypothetical protein V1318_05815 [Lysobacter sp. CCNWLW3]|uniref:hypothetical protein n=1 Tax=unclassified Lysobacter TaxID=2635362 RepID=UPI002FD0CBBE